MALCASNHQSDSTLQQSVLCLLSFLVLIRIIPDAYKRVKIGPKHTYLLFKKSVFGLFIGSWSSCPYMNVGLICNVTLQATDSGSPGRVFAK